MELCFKILVLDHINCIILFVILHFVTNDIFVCKANKIQNNTNKFPLPPFFKGGKENLY